jgi:hypothetical protein
MAEVENQIQRLPKLGKWFVEISYNSASNWNHFLFGIPLTLS